MPSHTLVPFLSKTVVLSHTGFVAFFIAACVMNFERSIGLVVLTCLAVASKAYDLLKKYKGDSFQRCLAPTVSLFQKNLRWIKWHVDVIYLYFVYCRWWFDSLLTLSRPPQGFHRVRRGLADCLARSGHKSTTRTTDFLCRHLRVCPAFIHLLSKSPSCQYFLNDP